jgi:hypothetical protein
MLQGPLFRVRRAYTLIQSIPYSAVQNSLFEQKQFPVAQGIFAVTLGIFYQSPADIRA